jgi:hypothetical protein
VRVRGTVTLRPARWAVAFQEFSPLDISAVASRATTVWGGAAGIFLPVGADQRVIDYAVRRGIDFVVAGDTSSDAAALAATEGFRWVGPTEIFPEPREYERLASCGTPARAVLDSEAGSLYTWQNDDPLANLFDVWLGRYPQDSHGGGDLADLDLSDRFQRIPLQPTDKLPGVPTNTPLQLTMAGLRRMGFQRSASIALVDPDSPTDLISFWNTRASGEQCFPWPVRDGDRVSSAVEQWLTGVRSLPRSAGSAEPSASQPFQIGLSVGDGAQVPDDLQALLESLGVRWVRVHNHPLAHGMGALFESRFRRGFDLQIDRDSDVVNVPLPDSPWSQDRDGAAEPDLGQVAAEVRFDQQADLEPGWSASIPAVRWLSPLVRRWDTDVRKFARPLGEGRVLSTWTRSDSVAFRLVPAVETFEALFRDEGWHCTQSDEGKFESRLVQRLGGLGSETANQPAIRAILRLLGRADRSVSYGKLYNHALTERGSWPHLLMRADSPEDYARKCVSQLAYRGLMEPTYPVKCPACATEVDYAADAMSAEMTCPFCQRDFRFGFTLAVRGSRADWDFRLSAHVSHSKLQAALAVMATLDALLVVPGRAASWPHMLGLVCKTPGRSFEIDLALVGEWGGQQVVVLAEVKGGRDEFTAADVSNLRLAQERLRANGLECVLALSTLRRDLSANECALIRPIVDAPLQAVADMSADGSIYPLLLVGQDLSVPWSGGEDQHPLRWVRSRPGWAALARESCRRNLPEGG